MVVVEIESVRVLADRAVVDGSDLAVVYSQRSSSGSLKARTVREVKAAKPTLRPMSGSPIVTGETLTVRRSGHADA